MKIKEVIEELKENPDEILTSVDEPNLKKIIDYLTDTTYYDQHLKAIDKSKHNKA